MSAIATELFDDTTQQTLCSLAFYALNQGQDKQADQMFEMLMTIKPESPLPYIGLANGQLQQGKADHAVALLQEQALPRCDQGPVLSLTTAYLGLALCMSGETRASDECFDRVLAADDNPSAVSLVDKVRAHFGTRAKNAPASAPVTGNADKLAHGARA